MLITLRRASSPSVVSLLGVNELPPDQHTALVIANLPPSPTTWTAVPSCPSDLTTSESEASYWPDATLAVPGMPVGHRMAVRIVGYVSTAALLSSALASSARRKPIRL